jgi:preprotein translocase subunit SecG
MQNILLTIHIIACIALVIAIMLQRSEGGALGMSGGGTGGIISGRGAAGVLVKVTMALAATFFTTSVAMTWLNNQANSAPGILERQIQQDGTGTPLGTGGLSSGGATTPPATTQPATPAPAPTTTVDPLAPSSTAPAPTTPAPATTTPATGQTAPATPPPAEPTTPENGGSNN